MIKVNSAIQAKLLQLPESGMGYQVVEATFKNKVKKETLILNATLAEPTDGRSVGQIMKSLSLQETNELYKFAEESNEIIDVEFKREFGTFKKAGYGTFAESRGAESGNLEKTEKDEYFIRFSHFEDDRRIDKKNKKVLPGSYATTLDDANYCLKNNIDPRARYALPNNLTIEYKFHIEPEEEINIRRGTVEPANDQPGGGFEVIFPNGTNNDSLTKIEKL